MIAHGDMACQGSIVGEHTVVAYLAVVRNMAVGHDQAVVADHGLPPVFGAAVDGYILADGGVVAYFNGGVLACKFEVLWNS